MFRSIKRIFNRLINKATNIHHEPINKVSLVILILIDIFVLFNVFSGLNSISEWPLAPQEEFPCFSAYESYQTAKDKNSFQLNATTIENLIYQNNVSPTSVIDSSNRLGRVSTLCAEHTRLTQAINNDANRKIKTSITQLRNQISSLNEENRTLQSQYNSTLLEKIAGQARQRSINKVSADQVKLEIDKNKQQITDKQRQIVAQQTKLIQYPASDAYLKLLNNNSEYTVVKQSYDSAAFWYPSKQLILQTLFLLPLITIAYLWHSVSIRNNRGLQALLSWHLLLIFCIPLLIKLFDFLQFGNLFRIVIDLIVAIFGGLLFIASYVFILIIPLLGFGLIKILQILVFNRRLQARRRIQSLHCINCNSKLRLNDEFCPYCGFNQYIDCSNCHQKTYKFTDYCSKCGHTKETDNPLV